MAQVLLNIPDSQLPIALNTLSEARISPVQEWDKTQQNGKTRRTKRKQAASIFQKTFDKINQNSKPYSEQEFEQIWQKIKQND